MTPTSLKDCSPSADDMRKLIFAILHDLKEPLNTVNYRADNLAHRLGGKHDQTNQDVSVIRSVTDRMCKLLDDTAAFVATGGTLSRGPVDLEEVLCTALSNLDAAIHTARAVITREPLPVVNGNFEGLVLVLQNLIANAIKFRREEYPLVHVRCSTSVAGWLLSVRDNGIGISPKFHQWIFEPFKRLHSQQEYPGSGLGLATCRRIVALHGGRLWLESALGKGSTFFFTLGKPQPAVL